MPRLDPLVPSAPENPRDVGFERVIVRDLLQFVAGGGGSVILSSRAELVIPSGARDLARQLRTDVTVFRSG